MGAVGTSPVGQVQTTLLHVLMQGGVETPLLLCSVLLSVAPTYAHQQSQFDMQFVSGGSAA
jgi:hypothetical protein